MKIKIDPVAKPRQISAKSRATMGGATRFKPKHGMKGTPEYNAWWSMNGRCYNQNSCSYRTHGARGIRVCARWRRSFENFYSDMGSRPEGYSLDRIDNDGDYEPSNCRWATPKTQQRNKSNNKMLTAFGETLCLAEWSERIGVKQTTISKRLGRGDSPDRALRCL